MIRSHGHVNVGFFANDEVSFACWCRALCIWECMIKSHVQKRAACYGVGLFASDEVSFACWRRALCKWEYMITSHLQTALYSCANETSLFYYGAGRFANTEVSFAKQMRTNDQVSLAKSPLLICSTHMQRDLIIESSLLWCRPLCKYWGLICKANENKWSSFTCKKPSTHMQRDLIV